MQIRVRKDIESESHEDPDPQQAFFIKLKKWFIFLPLDPDTGSGFLIRIHTVIESEFTTLLVR
jgi:hypothetical protein